MFIFFIGIILLYCNDINKSVNNKYVSPSGSCIIFIICRSFGFNVVLYLSICCYYKSKLTYPIN